MDTLTIRDRTRALVSDKRAHVDRLRIAIAQLQAATFGPFPDSDVEKPAPAREDSIEGDLMWLMELNQDTRNALDVLDSLVSKIVPSPSAAGHPASRAYRDVQTPATGERMDRHIR